LTEVLDGVHKYCPHVNTHFIGSIAKHGVGEWRQFLMTHELSAAFTTLLFIFLASLIFELTQELEDFLFK
jgi:hypothetical protein